MKILFISSGSGSRGGGEIYLKLLSEGLSNLGHDIHALVGHDRSLDELASAMTGSGMVYRLPMQNTYRRKTRVLGAVLDRAQQKNVQHFIQRLCPDIIHVNQQVAEDGLDLLLAAKASGLPFLSTIHITRSALSLAARLGRFRDSVTETTLRLLKAEHIVVAEHARRDLIARLGDKSRKRIAVIPNGVCSRTNKDVDRTTVRRIWGVEQNEIVIGCVGRLEAQKDPLFVLDVVAELRRRGCPIKLVWIGDGELRQLFRQRARDLDVAAVVSIDGWCEDVEHRLAGLDIFVLASKFEGLSLALLEAMHAGLAICVTDTPGMAEAVQDGITGFICSTGNRTEWTSRLVPLIEDGGLRMRIGAAARSRAHADFSFEQMCRLTLKEYERVKASYARGQN